MNCGEAREIAAHGLCFRCYRNDARQQQKAEAIVDRHTPGIRKEQKKLIKAFASIMSGLADLGVNKHHILEVRAIFRPYLAPVAEYLFSHDIEEPEVNSEHIRRNVFTVHNALKKSPTPTLFLGSRGEESNED